MFDHFILTRFNVREPWADDNKHVGIDESWLERRFELFERVCLPSMIRQSVKNFQWLIFMDLETPDRFVRRMKHLHSQHDYLIPVYCRDRGEEFVLQEMKDRGSSDSMRIMTRLDNDDVLHPRMAEKIQNLALKQVKSANLTRGFFVTFPLGYTEHYGNYYLQYFRCNPFVSFVSVPDYNKTIFGWDHTKIDKVAPVIRQLSWPMWCQVIHGENVANTVRGLYWPLGRCSGLVVVGAGEGRRSFAWQCAEFWRSFRSYIMRR